MNISDEHQAMLKAARERMIVEAGKAAPPAAPGGPPAASAAPKAKPRRRAGEAGRWATLNAFHDTIARHLAPAEQAVWGQLFRWCREGKVSASTRGIADACGIDKETATFALAKLKAVGLVWPVNLSRHKGTASVYGLHPHPDLCLGKCQESARPRRRPK